MNNAPWISFLPIIIFGGLLFWYARRFRKSIAKKIIPPEAEGLSPYGVGGFLGAFIFFRIVFYPMFIISSLNDIFWRVENVAPEILQIDGWHSFKMYYLICSLAILICNWWVAYDLANRFNSRSARNAKILIALTPYLMLLHVLVSYIFLDFNIFGDNLLIHFLVSFCLAVISFLYFFFSQRIKNTYYLEASSKIDEVVLGVDLGLVDKLH